MKVRYWTPLLGFVISTVVIGYGFVFPRNGLASVNELTVGFATTILSASVTYVLGIRLVLRDHDRK